MHAQDSVLEEGDSGRPGGLDRETKEKELWRKSHVLLKEQLFHLQLIFHPYHSELQLLVISNFHGENY